MSEPSGKKLDALYKDAWLSGLKTTYYLRTMGATHAEKSTITDHRLNQVGKGASAPAASPQAASPSPSPSVSPSPSPSAEAPQACSILDPDCEACQ